MKAFLEKRPPKWGPRPSEFANTGVQHDHGNVCTG